MRRPIITLGLGVSVAALGMLVCFGLFGFELEENLALPVLIKSGSPRPAPREVLLVDLDKPAADRLGLALDPSDWPRTIYANLVERLARAGAAVIVFDVFFREARPGGQDEALSQAVRRAGNVLLFAYLRRQTAELPVPASGGALNVERLVLPTPAIADAAAGLAPFALPKNKARVSQFWTFRRSAGDRPTLPAVALQLYALHEYGDLVRLVKSVRPDVAARLPRHPQVGDPRQLVDLMDRLKSELARTSGLGEALFDRLDEDPQFAGDPVQQRRLTALLRMYHAGSLHYLNFYGPPRSVPTVSYTEVLRDDGALLDVAGKVVFIGYAAGFQPDQKDGFYTVYSQPDGLDISGVEVAATAFANLLDQSTLQPLQPAFFIAVITAYGLLAAGAARRGSAVSAVALSLLLPLAYGWVVFAVFKHYFVWLPLAIPVLIQSPVALVAGLAVGFWETRRERNRIRQAFGHYLPNRVIDQLLRGRGGPHGHQELRYGICLASDAEQYTALAETMSPQQLQRFMNRYYTSLFTPVRANGGVVSDVVGDAMLAVWSASTNSSALREQACRAALEIAHGSSASAESEPHLSTRIGLHAGELALGHVGALDHFEYRAVGDIVNTASRIEGVNKVLGTRLIASAEVIQGIAGIVTRELGSFRLAGKQQAVVLHELLGETAADAALQQLAARFAQGLVAYRNRNWEQAAGLFSGILQVWPQDGPSRFYRDLCRAHAAGTPPAPGHPTVSLTQK